MSHSEYKRAPLLGALCLLLTFFYVFPVQAQNQLKGHPSPYLALHGDDPVNWRDWGENAMATARENDQLLLLSIGYFSCHWCHVMQRESFQNQDIAAKLNKEFVSVKIDRELEPALDARLIAFSESTLGRAGWPLNVFVTPDGYPLYAVLYMPATQFTQVLDRLGSLWREDPDRLRSIATRVATAELPDADPSIDVVRARQLRDIFVEQALVFHDDFEGGFGNQNKFPQSPALSYLLDIAADEPSKGLLALLESTLDAMAGGGLFDHVGGGFFRYVVDPSFNIPHFEKMLYDNADLARVYLDADKVLPGRGYDHVAVRTLDFMQSELKTGAGAMVAALSAVDDQDVEGGYYLWREETLDEVLPEDQARIIKARCAVRGASLLSAGHHLRCSSSVEFVAQNLGISEAEALEKHQLAIDHLAEWRRDNRVVPVDNKLLAGWNGLALSAFSQAGAQLAREDYAQIAQQIRDYLVEVLWNGEALSRAVDGKTSIGSASLEDYAYVARGLWDFARYASRPEDAKLAQVVHQAGWNQFRMGNGWQMGASAPLAPPPPLEWINDSPLDSPAAIMAELAVIFAAETGDALYQQQANAALSRGYEELAENAFFNAIHIRAQNRLADLQQP